MLESSALMTFAVASFVMIVVPGPAVLYIITQSIDQGRKAGMASVVGISVGEMGHVTAAALGISAILVSSALAFNIVKYLGAAYLIYLGVRKLMEKTPEYQEDIAHEPQKLSNIFRQGVIVSLLNPKAALFFFAFLPQFIDPNRGSPTLQIFLLGTVFVTIAMFSDGTYALMAGTFGKWLKNNRQFLNMQKYVSGAVYIFLGVMTALSGSKSE